jgi:hypothetical protein
MAESLALTDFADALRQMAENADKVADQHDIAKMARLQDLVAVLRDKAQQDADLIAELRRRVASAGRALDGISQLRGKALKGDQSGSVVDILADALLLISEDGCESFIEPWSCRDEESGRNRSDPLGTSGLWCDACVARDALERAGWIEDCDVQ